MQSLLMNRAHCSRLGHGCHHELSTFSASRDEETKSQGRQQPRNVWVLSLNIGDRQADVPVLEGQKSLPYPHRGNQHLPRQQGTRRG